MNKGLLGILALLAGISYAGEAKAALSNINGYVCSSTYTRQNNVSFGQGYVRLQVNSAAKCGGTSLGAFYYVGSGATINGFQFSEAERLQLFEQAIKASKEETRVNLFVETNGGGIFHTTYFAN